MVKPKKSSIWAIFLILIVKTYLNLSKTTSGKTTKPSIGKAPSKPQFFLTVKIKQLFYPAILEYLIPQFSKGLVLITGKNGKTTTNHFLETIFKDHKVKTLSITSDNLDLEQFISELISNLKWNLKFDQEIVIVDLNLEEIENFYQFINPQYVLMLNSFNKRIEHLLPAMIKKTQHNIFFNRHDKKVLELNQDFDAKKNRDLKISYYGVSEAVSLSLENEMEIFTNVNSRNRFLPYAKIVFTGFHDGKLTFNYDGHGFEINHSFLGLHNAINFCAALGLASEILSEDFDIEIANNTASIIAPIGGRGEKLEIKDQEISLMMVKNSQGFKYAIQDDNKLNLQRIICLDSENHKNSEHHYSENSSDTSWIWDVDFKVIKFQKFNLLGGNLAYDMAVRLDLDNIEYDKVILSLEHCLNYALENDRPLRIYANDIAMAKIKKYLNNLITE